MPVGNGGLRISREIAFRSADVRRGDLADQASSDQEFHRQAAVGHLVQKVLKAISLQERIFPQRKGMGVQAVCVDCQGEIPLTRREAMPTAIRCLVCEDLKDQKRS